MPHGWSKDYNHAERLLWQDPEQILAEIGLKPGDTMADVGAGDGFFAIPAAKIVGASGVIYALDSSAEAVAGLKDRARQAGLTNVRAVIGDADDTVLCRRCADVALLANVLHDFESPLKVLANIRQTLKPGGVLADLDWKKEPEQLHGPPLTKRLSQEEATALLIQANFEVIKNKLSGPFHYLLLARTH